MGTVEGNENDVTLETCQRLNLIKRVEILICDDIIEESLYGKSFTVESDHKTICNALNLSVNSMISPAPAET